jgi:hypothetical protein
LGFWPEETRRQRKNLKGKKALARTRTTKKLAQRIDLNYFKRPTRYKRAKLLLCVLVPLLAIGWITWRGFSRDSRVYSSGRMSEPHAVLEKQCAACHLQKAGEFSSRAVNSGCLSCHDGPVHHETELRAAVPDCAGCHAEHRGRVNIRAASNQSCAGCHANLKTTSGTAGYAAHIRSFEDGHPEFAALRGGARDPGSIRLNHAIHMKPIRRGPNGPIVQLDCWDCHRAAAVATQWKYGDTNFVNASVSYKDADVFLPTRAETLSTSRGLDGREYMAPVKFATACAGCHSLAFDKLIDEPVPHDKPEAVRAFVVKKLQEYISTHPADVRVPRDPSRDLTGKPLQPEVRILTPSQWVAERTAGAEELLWRKTCKQCHVLQSVAGSALPSIAPGHLTQRWLPHAKFDHDAHRGFTCVSCHSQATTSKDSSDILVPGIATCQTCHAPGPEHAESRCFECHTYHDWAKRKEVRPTFTLPQLQTGGK